MAKSKEVVEYLEDSHTYLVNGVIVPSVTRIVDYLMGNEYSNVPETTLKAKAQYGTEVHEAIEKYITTKEVDEAYKEQVEAFKEVAIKKQMLLVKDMEQIVHYKNLYAGRYDICDEFGIIWDIKTTAKLHEESLSWQLSLYYLAKYGEVKEFGYAIWLPKKGKPQVVKITCKTKEEVLQALDDYKEQKTRTTSNELVEKEVYEIITDKDIEMMTELEMLSQAVADRQKQIQDSLMAIFKAKGVKSFKSDKLDITYVAPSTRSSLDKTKVEALIESSGLKLEDYQKTSNVGESLRIKVK